MKLFPRLFALAMALVISLAYTIAFSVNASEIPALPHHKVNPQSDSSVVFSDCEDRQETTPPEVGPPEMEPTQQIDNCEKVKEPFIRRIALHFEGFQEFIFRLTDSFITANEAEAPEWIALVVSVSIICFTFPLCAIPIAIIKFGPDWVDSIACLIHGNSTDNCNTGTGDNS